MAAPAAPPFALVRGQAASGGRSKGRARVLRGEDELDRVRPGDVLVTRCATPAVAAVLPLVGAIVTDDGGAPGSLVRAAREHGVPVVTDTEGATAAIPDGALVFVDGDRGFVATVRPAVAALRWMPAALRPQPAQPMTTLFSPGGGS